MRALYIFAIRVYVIAIKVAALFDAKAKKWVEGRKNWRTRYPETLKNCQDGIWMHCASLGEFEQGRPLLEELNATHPELPVVVSFYSPSGYEVRKNWEGADAVIYLPHDTPKNARDLIEMIRPKAVIWVKYEFWFSYLTALKSNETPLFLVSGIFRPLQHFFRWWGKWFARQLRGFTVIFVQDERSKELLARLGYSSVVTGDTRFDRVISIAEQTIDLPAIEAFKADHECIVAGSSWPQEEAFLANYLRERRERKLKLIVVPHEVDEAHISALSKLFGSDSVVFSAYRPDAHADKRVLIVDRVGMLSVLYRYADLAVIGGGFGAGIHNVAEAAVYGVPVLFGPAHIKFNEALGLLDCGGAFDFFEGQELADLLDQLLHDYALRIRSGQAAEAFIRNGSGASKIIANQISRHITKH